MTQEVWLKYIHTYTSLFIRHYTFVIFVRIIIFKSDFLAKFCKVKAGLLHTANKEIGCTCGASWFVCWYSKCIIIIRLCICIVFVIIFHILSWLSARPWVSEPEKYLALQMADLHVRNTRWHLNTNMSYTQSQMPEQRATLCTRGAKTAFWADLILLLRLCFKCWATAEGGGYSGSMLVLWYQCHSVTSLNASFFLHVNLTSYRPV